MSKEVKIIVKMLVRDGWELVSQKNHIKMWHIRYGTQIIPKTPRCPHWKKNLLKQIEHKYKVHGAIVPA